MRFCFLVLLFAASLPASSQRSWFSTPVREEDENIGFEILGKSDSSYVIYKKIRWKHVISSYDREMRLISSSRMDFLPDKTFEVFPVLLQGFIYLCYQYQKGTVVYCYGVKVNTAGKKMSEPVLLDTTRVNVLSENKIYAVVRSDNRQRLLVYKMQLKNGNMTFMAKLFSSDLIMLDSSRINISFEDKRDYITEPALANDGRFLFCRQFRDRNRGNYSAMQVFQKNPGRDDFLVTDLGFGDNHVYEVTAKADNVNGSFIINGLSLDTDDRDVSGLFSAVIRQDGSNFSNFNSIDDSVRYALDPKGNGRTALNNLVVRNFHIRRNGGFTLVAENSYSQGQGNSDLNRWNYLNNYPYSSVSDYYVYNPYYYGLYRPPGFYSPYLGTRYYDDEILVFGLDSALRLNWNSIIRKKQFDDDNENFLSFSNLNAGGELHFLFSDKTGSEPVLSDQSVTPSGKLIRYPSLKVLGKSYSYMPSLAKQVGVGEMIMPCSFQGQIVFARLLYDN